MAILILRHKTFLNIFYLAGDLSCVEVVDDPRDDLLAVQLQIPDSLLPLLELLIEHGIEVVGADTQEGFVGPDISVSGLDSDVVRKSLHYKP